MTNRDKHGERWTGRLDWHRIPGGAGTVAVSSSQGSARPASPSAWARRSRRVWPADWWDRCWAWQVSGRGPRFGRMFRDPPVRRGQPGAAGRAHGDRRAGRDARRAGRPGARARRLIVDPALSVTTPTTRTTRRERRSWASSWTTTSPSTRPPSWRSRRSPRHEELPYTGVRPRSACTASARSPATACTTPSDVVKFKVETGGLFEDLPRAMDASAVIPDPRNDENLIIAGLHAAVLLFHNRIVDERAGRHVAGAPRGLRRGTPAHDLALPVDDPPRVPAAVRRPAPGRPRSGGRAAATSPRRRRSSPSSSRARPSGSGTASCGPSYRANLAGDDGAPFFGFILDPAEIGEPDPADMSGGARAPRRFIGWQTFFDFGDGEVKPNKLIDTTLSTPLFNLPPATIVKFTATDIGPTSLPQRTLLRHLTWELPSGQRLARRMSLPVLSAGDLGRPLRVRPGTRTRAPRCSSTSSARRSSSRAGSGSDRSEDGSSPRSSSACSRPTPTRSSPPSRAGDRPFPARKGPGHFRDGRLPDLRRRGPGIARPVGVVVHGP